MVIAATRRSPLRRSRRSRIERAPVAAVTRGLTILAIVWQALTMFPDPVFWPWRQQSVLDGLILAAAWGCWFSLVALTLAHRRPTPWSVRIQTLDAVLMVAAGLHLLAWAPTSLEDGWLAAASLINLGIGLVGIAMPMRWSIPVVLATVAVVIALFAGMPSDLGYAGEALQYGLYALAVGAAVISSRRALLHAATRSERAQTAQERAVVDAAAAHAVQHRVVELTRLLHETVLNTLNAIVRGVPDTADARARSAERCRQSLEVLQSLRDVALAGEPEPSLSRAVEAQVSDLTSVGVVVEVDIDGPQQVPIAVRNAFTAVAREALINVARHARAGHVRLTARAEADAWAVGIIDDGVGFEVPDTSRLGIAVMRASVESLGGELTIDSIPGRGTTVQARVPRSQEPESAVPGSGNEMALPVLASFLALCLASLFGGWDEYQDPVFAVAAFALAVATSVLILSVGHRRVLPWWGVVTAALLAPVIYHLQGAASGGSALSTWNEWSSEFIVAMLFVVVAGGPRWAWLVALASWLFTQGDPLGELLQPGTAVIIAGALYARSVTRSNEAHHVASHARLAQQTAERADETSTRRVTRRFTELADSTATDLFAGLADGSVDVLDEQVRRRCAAQERYIRTLMRIDPQRSVLDAMTMRLTKQAHQQGVVLDVDMSEDVFIDERRLAEFEASARQSLDMIDLREPARLTARRESGRNVVRLVAQVKAGRQPVREAPTCLVLWDDDSRSAMWEVEK